jgi:hypothetical protein
LLQIGALVFFFLAAFGFAGPLKAGELPETMPPYIFLFGCFVLLGLAEIVRRLPAAK